MSVIKMGRSHWFVAIFIATVVPALAEDHDLRSGLYQSETGQDLSIVLEHLSDKRYAIDITTRVQMVGTQPGCGGGISGELVIAADEGMLKIPNAGFLPDRPETAANMRQCQISLHFLDEFTIQLEEVSGCSYYHGASCSFTGIVIHEASGI